MRTFPQNIKVVQDGSGRPVHILVDGEELNAFTTGGAQVNVVRDGPPTVTVTLIAETVTVEAGGYPE